MILSPPAQSSNPSHHQHAAPDGAHASDAVCLGSRCLITIVNLSMSYNSVILMANTYTQIYVQVVFAVQARQNLIRSERKEELHKYITGIVSRQGQKLIAIHCMPDHTHILLGLKPNLALSDLVGDIKTGSTNHINENSWGIRALFMARGVWRVLLLAFAIERGDQLYSQPGEAPPNQDISAGIQGIPNAIRDYSRRPLPFRTSGR